MENPVRDDRVIVGFGNKDDAAVLRLDGDRYLIQTVDFFTPIVDDPYQYGQIAAANSLSDIYAMGGRPLFALNIVGFPIRKLPHHVLRDILQGGIDKAAEAGIAILGGHSVDDQEPKYGLVVTGEVARTDLITNAGARPGDVLILTKPLGTGLISTAVKQGVASPEASQTAVRSMKFLNKTAAECLIGRPVHAATDVSGFGLLGHLLELCEASGVRADIEFDSLPLLPDVFELLKQDIIPGGTRRNLAYVEPKMDFPDDFPLEKKLLAADAQTSGGLLIAMPASEAEQYLRDFNPRSPFEARIIGKILPARSGSVIRLF